MKYGTFVRSATACGFADKFKRLKELGFDCCQLVYKPEKYDLSEALAIRRGAEDSGIEIAAQFCGYYDQHTVYDLNYGFLTSGLNVEAYRASRLEYVLRAAEFAAALGTPDILIHAGYVPNNPFTPEYATMLSSVNAVAKTCQRLGLNLCLETGQEAPIVLRRLIEDVGRKNVKINFDTGNVLMYGLGNPTDAARVFGGYVRSVHGKDGCLPDRCRELGKETRVGEGMVDFKAVFGILKGFGFDRNIILERELTLADGLEGEALKTAALEEQQDLLNGKRCLEKLWNEAVPTPAQDDGRAKR